MIGSIASNYNLGFGRRFNTEKVIHDYSHVKIDPKQLIGNLPDQELLALNNKYEAGKSRLPKSGKVQQRRAVSDRFEKRAGKAAG